MKVHLLVSAMVIGIAGGAVWAADDVQGQLQAMQDQLQSQQAQISAQSAEINRLRSAAGETWLNERRAEEIKTLVRDVLSDAQTRASLLDSAVTAGHNGEHFFLASDDGNFLLNVGGQIQVRYIYNNTDNVERNDGESSSDEETEGFVNRRTKVNFFGHVVNPKLTYYVTLSAFWGSYDFEPDNDIGSSSNSGNGDVIIENAWIAYDFADQWNLKVGQFKAPFMRDELVHSSQTLAVERAVVTDLFTIDYTQGAQVSWHGEQIRAAAMFHDGSYMANTNYDGDLSDFAIAARVEALLTGSWEQFDDYVTWSTDSTGLMVGAAIDWENSEQGGLGTSSDNFDVLKWTLDVSAEFPNAYGLSVAGAVVGRSFDADFTPGGSTAAVDSADQWGVIIQGSAFIQPDKWDVFVRYEYIDFDGAHYHQTGAYGAFYDTTTLDPSENDEVNMVTIGTNYYFAKHQAKATFDFVWIDSPLNFDDTGAGVQEAFDEDDDEQYVLRAQLQLLF